MEHEPQQRNWRQIYNFVDWIDLGLVAAIIFYYSRLMGGLELSTGMDYTHFFSMSVANATPIGILLLLASLTIAIVFIYLTIKMRKLRLISAARATVRMIWNGIWIPLDVFFLLMILFS